MNQRYLSEISHVSVNVNLMVGNATHDKSRTIIIVSVNVENQ